MGASTFIKKSSDKHKYWAQRWRRISARHLRHHPLCVMCDAVGRVEIAVHTDHIQPHKGSDELFYDTNNLQSLCLSCHTRKTIEENYTHTPRASSVPTADVVMVCGPTCVQVEQWCLSTYPDRALLIAYTKKDFAKVLQKIKENKNKNKYLFLNNFNKYSQRQGYIEAWSCPSHVLVVDEYRMTDTIGNSLEDEGIKWYSSLTTNGNCEVVHKI